MIFYARPFGYVGYVVHGGTRNLLEGALFVIFVHGSETILYEKFLEG